MVRGDDLGLKGGGGRGCLCIGRKCICDSASERCIGFLVGELIMDATHMAGGFLSFWKRKRCILHGQFLLRV